MPRGGARPGAGRPKRKSADHLTKAQVETAAALADQTPLEFMLATMNDRSASQNLRAQMAVAAAPYVHPKPAEKGKRAASQEKADQIASRFRGVGPPTLKAVPQNG